jgi:hypothetical protein
MADTDTPSLPDTATKSRGMTAGSLGLCGPLPRIDRDDVITVEHAGRNWTGTLAEALEVGAIRRA